MNNNIVRLWGREDMVLRLSEVMNHNNVLKDSFFPPILEKAGQEIAISEIPEVMAKAFQTFQEKGRMDLVASVYDKVPSFAKAIVSDRHFHQEVEAEISGAMDSGRIWS